MNQQKLTGAVVGCGGIGGMHARGIVESKEIELVAVCDTDETRAKELAGRFGGVPVYTDFADLLAVQRPDIVAIAVPTVAHAPLTLQAVEAGVRGICCEKPMGISLGEGRAMVQACRRAGTQLVVNHQRRMYPPLVRMRQLITEGAIGEVTLLRGSCAGDLLSDGTHLIDSLLWLAGDDDATWVFGGLYRNPPDASQPRSGGFHVSGGYRYGHPVETGAFGMWEFHSGIRAEILCGELRLPDRGYQDYEVLGTQGRLWRPGDSGDPPLLIQTGGTKGWQPVDLKPAAVGDNPVAGSYALLARNVREGGGDHPLSGDRALRGLEILMAVHEAARLRQRIQLPLAQERYPLELLLEQQAECSS